MWPSLFYSTSKHIPFAQEDNRCLVLNALPIWDKQDLKAIQFFDLTTASSGVFAFLSSLWLTTQVAV